MNAIFHRVSIRKFEERKVEEEKIELLLRAAMAAPSACNQQPWEYYIVVDPEMIHRLSATSPYAKFSAAAPLVLVPCYRHEGKAPSYWHIDMSASVENVLLEADELGLGATWMGIAPQQERMEAVEQVLGIPDTLSAFALIAVGYPAESRPQQDRYDVKRIHWVREGEV